MPWDTARPWDVERAWQVARRLTDLGVYWMEEPLHRGDIEGMAALRAATDLRIAGGERFLFLRPEAGLKKAWARVTEAQRDLSFAMIRAPFDGAVGNRCAAKLTVRDAAGKVVFEGTSKDERFDANDHVTVPLKAGEKYQVEAEGESRKKAATFAPLAAAATTAAYSCHS